MAKPRTARTVLQLLVPKILAWSAGFSNAVESEHIIIEETEGTQLAEVWDNIKTAEKVSIAKDSAFILAKMASATFSHYVNGKTLSVSCVLIIT